MVPDGCQIDFSGDHFTNSCSSLLYSYTIVSNTLCGSPSTLPLGCQALLIISITLYGSGPLGYQSHLSVILKIMTPGFTQ